MSKFMVGGQLFKVVSTEAVKEKLVDRGRGSGGCSGEEGPAGKLTICQRM